jgi:DNA repair photolyase
MVLISFSIDGLVSRILEKIKQTTLRLMNEKWRRVLEKFESDENNRQILDFWWKSRSRYGFKFLESPIIKLESYYLRNMTEKDAILDGGDSKEQLLSWFNKTYGDEYLDTEFIRISWDLDFDKGLTNPNKTAIDWFDSLKQKLYSINPFVYHKDEKKRTHIAKMILKKKTALKELDGSASNKKKVAKLKEELEELKKKYTILNKPSNPINCIYNCGYCYARNFFIRMPNNYSAGFYFSRLNGLSKCKDNVFVSSITDLFFKQMPKDFISFIIKKANQLNTNNCQLYYLTKNPAKYSEILSDLNPKTNWIGATIETDDYSLQDINNISEAPAPEDRIEDFSEIDYPNKFCSIEPNFKFTKDFGKKIKKSGIRLAFFGLNSNVKQVKDKVYKEPTATEIRSLMNDLKEDDILVIRKDNLTRIVPDNCITLDKFI